MGVLLWSRSVHRSRVAPTPAKGSVVEEVQGVGSTVVGTVLGMSALGDAGSHRAGAEPGIAVQWPELVDGTPVTSAVRCGC